MIDIKAAVIRGVEASEVNKFDFDRSKYLNASEAGGCIRKIWYSKHQPEAEEEQMWGYARRGTHGEKYFIDNLKIANIPLLVGDTNVQHSLQDNNRMISATPDDVIVYDDEWIGLEFKTIDPRTNRGNLPKPAHVLQLQIAMELVAQQDLTPEHHVKFEKGLLVYMCCSNFDDIIQFEIERDPSVVDRMAKRAKKVLNTRKVENLDREGKRDGGKECKTMCAFNKVCGVTAEVNTDRKRANRGSNIDKAAVRYMDLKDNMELMKAEQDGLKEDIKNELTARKTNKGMVGNIEISLAVSKGRASLDKKAVAAAGIDLSPFEKVGAPSERLTLKRV